MASVGKGPHELSAVQENPISRYFASQGFQLDILNHS